MDDYNQEIEDILRHYQGMSQGQFDTLCSKDLTPLGQRAYELEVARRSSPEYAASESVKDKEYAARLQREAAARKKRGRVRLIQSSNKDNELADLLLRCYTDKIVELNPAPGIERRTTFKYREGHVSLDITQPAITTKSCPCCGRPLEFSIYPGLKFRDALNLSWENNRILSLGALLVGMVLFAIDSLLGLIVLLFSQTKLIKDLIYNCELNILISSDMHALFLKNNNIAANYFMENNLQERNTYYNK